MPDYYEGQGGMQPFDVIDAFGLDFYEGNVVKYICRWRKKNGIEDLRKARRYVNEVIKRAEAEQVVTAEIWCDMPNCVNRPLTHLWMTSCQTRKEVRGG